MFHQRLFELTRFLLGTIRQTRPAMSIIPMRWIRFCSGWAHGLVKFSIAVGCSANYRQISKRISWARYLYYSENDGSP
jgi:hypothetical protein